MSSYVRRSSALGLCSVVALVGLCTAVTAQQVRRSPSDPPVQNLVRVDVVVTGPDGRPVRGLARDDFDLFEDGRRQSIVTFGEVDLEDTTSHPVPLPEDIRLNVATNEYRTFDRVVVLVIDDLHTPASGTPGLRDLAGRVIDRLGPDVPVGVIFTGGRAGLELTTDQALIGQTIDRIGGDARVTSAGLSPQERDRQVFGPIADAASVLQTDARRRRALVWISYGAAQDAVTTTGEQARRFRQAAREAGIAVYAIDPAGDAGLAALADSTGGCSVVDSDDAEGLTDRIVQDLDHHYLLSFRASTRPGFDAGSGPAGDLQPVAVRVRREGALVRYRLGPGEQRVPPPTLEDQMASHLTGVVPVGGARLRLFATPLASTGRDVPVMVAVEMSVPRAPLEAVDPLLRDKVQYEIHAIDLDSRRVKRKADRMDVVALRPRNVARSASGTISYEFLTWIDVPPGRYQIRASALSETLEVSGAVFMTLDVPDSSAAPLVLGGIVLGYPVETPLDETQPASNVGQSLRTLRPRFGGGGTGLVGFAPNDTSSRFVIDPAFDRRFDRWDALKLVFDVAHRDRSPDAAALVQVRDAVGRVVHSSRPAIGRRDREQVEIDLPIAQFTPGAYRVSVRAISGSTETRRDGSFVINGVPLPPGAEDPFSAVLEAARAAESAGPPPVETSPPASLLLRPGPDLTDRFGNATSADELAVAGWERYGQGDVEGAQVNFAAAVAAGTESPWIHYARGLAEFALGNYDVAATAWEFVLERQPDYEPTYFDLTDAYLSLDRTTDALGVLTEAAERWPGDAEVHNALGVVQYSRRQFDDAIASFQRATEVAPDDGLGHFNLGRAYQGRMIRWRVSRRAQTAVATDALADRDRQSAIAAYTRALALGGFFEWDARAALRVLVR